MQVALKHNRTVQSVTVQSVDGAQDLELLVKAMAVHEVAALARLYELTVRQVFAIALSKLRSKEDAEEIVFDVYIHAWRKALAYDARRGSVRAWLSIITKHRAIDRLRQRRISVSVEDQREPAVALLSTDFGPEQSLSNVQSSAAIHRALQSLTEDRRKLIGLAFFEGQTHQEIAAALGMPIGTVKSHVRRGLAAMQRYLAVDRWD